MLIFIHGFSLYASPQVVVQVENEHNVAILMTILGLHILALYLLRAEINFDSENG